MSLTNIMSTKPTRVEATIAGRKLTLETGQVARQAGGAVIATLGDTRCFAAATAGNARDDIDFFPLVCDYREKTEAAGKIPGGFFKREGRPTTKEILTMRLIDRSIRPMFAEGFKAEVQVMTSVMQYDGENNPDVVAMIAAFTAIRIAGMPFETTLGAVRIAHIDGKLVAFPSDTDRRENSRLDLVVSGHENGLCMVESSAKELTEEEMIDALAEAERVVQEIIDLANELVDRCAKPAMEFTAPSVDEDLKARVFDYEGDLAAAMKTDGKHERGSAMNNVKKAAVAALTSDYDGDDLKGHTKTVKEFFGDLKKHCERSAIISGRRVDGRSWDEIRQITVVPNFNERQHGSALFTRGETQALVIATLGTARGRADHGPARRRNARALPAALQLPALFGGRGRPVRPAGPPRDRPRQARLARLAAAVCRRRKISPTRCVWSRRSPSRTALPRWPPSAAPPWR